MLKIYLSPPPPPPAASLVRDDAGRRCLGGCGYCGCGDAAAGGGLALVSMRPRSLYAAPPPDFLVLPWPAVAAALDGRGAAFEARAL